MAIDVDEDSSVDDYGSGSRCESDSDSDAQDRDAQASKSAAYRSGKESRDIRAKVRRGNREFGLDGPDGSGFAKANRSYHSAAGGSMEHSFGF